MKRREFLGSVAAGTAALGLGGDSDPSFAANAYRPLPDNRTQALVEAAHFGRKLPASGSRGLAISTHPLASQAAVEILKEGGNAVDAACTAALTQTVVEPHMTTLTGVFSLQYFDARSGEISYLNASNNAPANFPVDQAQLGELGVMLRDGRGVTVPGFWAGIEAALGRFGTVPGSRVVAPAVQYARHGFSMHPFLWGEIFVSADKIGVSPEGREIFLPGGTLPKPGATLYQKRAADLLERLGDEGSDYFYRGGFAKRFSEKVQAAGGWITPEDFAEYEVIWQEPARSTYRGYDLLVAPDPDFGGVVFGEIMNMVEQMDIHRLGPAWDSGETTFKLMQIIADVGVQNVLDSYAGTTPSMAERLSKSRAQQRFQALGNGKPSNLLEVMDGAAVPPPGSNHLTVVDNDGNMATVLHSCMSYPWTNGLFVDGISICAAGAHYASGLPQPGKRINARISPHMFLKEGRCVLAGGSPSVSLLENITQNAINLLDFGMDIEAAVHKPRFGGNSMSYPGALMVETDMPESAFQLLQKSGAAVHRVNPWHWGMGSYDSIALAPENGMARACGDPRRTAMAIAV
ncbi:gamma-glutamyltransferase [Kineobactrum salinum]|uniref:Gamma-glutamyltransferase n=1 Tax=Kineobactrum salinum TaxID=2708301 RepID=A0A6C0U4Y7_9GAMM|nr:gamma-glutamyltransferase [Kineobactrum salinum]QIB66988.1 gamma-glutamyltransferase [Kineobactrum salinum]